MAIYEQPVRELIKNMIGELAPNLGEAFTREDALNWFSKRYPKIKAGTISAHLIRFSINAPSRLHHNPRGDEDRLYQVDSSRFRLFNPETDGPPLHSSADLSNIREKDKVVTIEESLNPHTSTFAYEKDLQSFLAKNLMLLEPGLKLYIEEGITGLEFPVDGRFIDILAIDKDKNLVVVELKVSKGHERVVGQIMRYMAWIEKNLAEAGQKVRGVIVAREISEDIKLACMYLPQVNVFEYELSVSLKPIGIDYFN
ncbi:MAG TPA: endonuclease NucS domain-containing protein [Methylophilus sp.]|uniref:endonuclease NucS domain-containing protein n=1 Tax=Methylophilus sp. TaxID=29541 RepID=UPI002C3C0933|nr:endonuclease NucS domain-containing protein [Methylophilus sp.]HSH85947.1 endonuclease NucS domain-containing protein [Methylophilus sp.]